MIWLITAPEFPMRDADSSRRPHAAIGARTADVVRQPAHNGIPSADNRQDRATHGEKSHPEKADNSLGTAPLAGKTHPEQEVSLSVSGYLSACDGGREAGYIPVSRVADPSSPDGFPTREPLHGNTPSEHEVVQAAFEAGLETLLLRKPGWNEQAYAGWLELLPERYHAKVIVSAFPSLADAFGLKGVHFSEEARRQTATVVIRKLRDAGRWVSTSIHHESADASGFDFVLLGPVFDSISKPGHNARSFASVPPNAIAVGGMDAINVGKARAMGFCGAAVLGAAWKHPERIGDIIAALQQAWASANTFIHRQNPGA